MQCHRTTLLALELTQALASLFFSSHSLDCNLVAIEKCVIPLSEPLDDHRPRLKLFRRSWRIQGPKGYWHTEAKIQKRQRGCCTPYIMDSLSPVNTRQREHQTEFSNQLGTSLIVLSIVCCFCFLAFGGMPTEPRVFLDFAGRMRAAALRPDPL